MIGKKPLDWEKIESIIIDEELGDLTFNAMMEKIKQQVWGACMFYLRYKDNPKSLIKEHPEYKKEMIKENSITTCVSDGILSGELKLLEEEKEIIILRKYNKWLFKVAFKFEEMKENETDN